MLKLLLLLLPGIFVGYKYMMLLLYKQPNKKQIDKLSFMFVLLACIFFALSMVPSVFAIFFSYMMGSCFGFIVCNVVYLKRYLD